MLYNLTDGELRVYKDEEDNNKRKTTVYIEMLFYNNDFSAPMYGAGDLKFSCAISDNNYADQMIDFFNRDNASYNVEYIWDGGSKKFGKQYKVRVERNNLMLVESGKIINDSKEEFLVMDRGNFDTNAHYTKGQSRLNFCFKGEVVNNKFITEFSEGEDIIK